MALLTSPRDTPSANATGSSGSPGGPVRSGFRPAARARGRIALGALLALISIGAILLVFSTVDQREPMVQAVVDIPAGTQLSAEMFRPVEISADSSLNIVSFDQLAPLLGQYARVRIISGGLLSAQAVQPSPLVVPGQAVVSITVDQGLLPVGVRERSQVQLVFTSDNPDTPPPAPVTGRVVQLPVALDTTGGSAISIEVSQADAITIAQQDDVRVVLLDPGADAAGAES
jgi:hypothetical protein